MITENTNLWRLGLNSLTKGFGRMLPRSGRQKQSGNGWTPLAVFSAFAATLLAFPQTTLAQQAQPSVMFASDAYDRPRGRRRHHHNGDPEQELEP